MLLHNMEISYCLVLSVILQIVAAGSYDDANKSQTHESTNLETLNKNSQHVFYMKRGQNEIKSNPQSQAHESTNLETLNKNSQHLFYMKRGQYEIKSNSQSLKNLESTYMKRDRRELNSEMMGSTSQTSCLYADISQKINLCFLNANNCSHVLSCIGEARLVETCGHFDMYTPAVWILNVFEVLDAKQFCQNRNLGCPQGWGTSKNESLEKLNDIMKAMHEYGPEFLDLPKVENKVYCAKSLNLVANVKDVFDQMDQCSLNEALSEILNEIDDTAKNILNKNCPYCITSNSIFDSCLHDYFGNDHNCSTTLSCVNQKIALYGCNEDTDETTLTVLSSFVTNISSICEVDRTANETTIIHPWVAVEWFRELEYCLEGKEFLGLTYAQAPKSINICQSMEETFKCIHQTLHDFRFIDKPLFRSKFAYFANQFNRMQRKCDLQSIQNVVATKQKIETSGDQPRHHFQSSQEHHVFEENQKYYHQSIIWPRQSQLINWIDIDTPEFARFYVHNDKDLSENYLKATVVNLRFSFPFYGHKLDRLIVATGGFIYVGETMNSLITKTQYIAPLMGNFNPALNNRAAIKYVDNGTHFICTWENLLLKDQPQNGEYTFQVILTNTGDIMFNYKSIPSNHMISDSNHEVKIGLSDGYTVAKPNNTDTDKVVQYHNIDISLDNVRTGNSIMLFMLKNCIQLNSCESCVMGVGKFKCIWCPALERCSDTLDRYRQEWIESSCPIEITTGNQTCQGWLNPRFNYRLYKDQAKLINSEGNIKYSDYVKAITIGVFSTLLVSLVLISSAWVFYAYNNPTSTSGIWLIEHRPSKIIPMLSFNFRRETTGATRFEDVE